MNGHPESVVGEVVENASEALHSHDLMNCFDELSFHDKWRHVFAGLKEPRQSGEHKWARLQIMRLLSPLMAVIVPVLMIGLITLLAQMTPELPASTPISLVAEKPDEVLDKIEPPDEVKPLEPPEPIDVPMVSSTDMQSSPEDIVTTPVETANVQLTAWDSVPMVKSPLVIRLPPSRSPVGQIDAVRKHVGEHTIAPVLRALRWLAKNQNDDGSWGLTKPAITSLALLAYLAHGETPASPEFGRAVEAGLRYLLKAQKPDGRFVGADGHDYTQPIAAFALAEAYGMTRIPQIKEAAVKAIREVIKGQNPSGGFNYSLKPSDRDDTSYMAWCVQALKAANVAGLAHDVEGLDACMQKAILGFRKNYGEANGYGGFGYTGPSASHGISGAGVLCMQFLGEAKSKEVRSALPMLQQKWAFNWDEPPAGSVVYYWYYITQVFFMEGGPAWESWNQQFSHGLTKAQDVIGKDASGYVDHEGHAQEIGSWTSPAKNEHNGGNGKVMDTILCTLMLEVYYRYLPNSMQIPEDVVNKDLGQEDDLTIEISDYRRH